MKTNGAKALILSLIEEEVEVLFGYPGGAIMPAFDELLKAGRALRHVLVRHEQGAAFAAGGYARATGRPGVCLVTSGPGATNLMTGIADAMADSVPLVCITGQVPSSLLGREAFQEADIIGMSLPATKWSFQVTRAEEIPGAIAKAFHIAKSGRPGPVLIDITKDAQLGTLEFDYGALGAKKTPDLDPEALKQAARLLNEAQRPYLLIGRGILLSGAEREVRALSEKAGIPVASTLLGLSAFPSDHPLYAGMLGMHGNYGANVLTNKADVILAVGMRFDDRVTGNLARYAKQARVIHIEIDRAQLHKNVRADVALHADAREGLRALLPLVKSGERPGWMAEFRRHDKIEAERLSKPETGSLRMAEVASAISAAAKGEALIVTDVGQHQMAAARYCRFSKPNSHLTSGGLGAMGFALPAAIGAKLGSPEREVVAVIGDGGFQMSMQELAVVAQERLPVKIVILNNGYLGMVRQWQELFFEKRYSAVDLLNPEFTRIASAYGIRSAKVTDRRDLPAALSEMSRARGPFLLEVAVEREENVFPMIPAGAAVDEVLLS